MSISSVKKKTGHKYLDIKLIPTDNFDEIIKFNFNDRKNRMSKFYAWLTGNDETPIEIKILVLDNCLFSAILYSIETWEISNVSQMNYVSLNRKP